MMASTSHGVALRGSRDLLTLGCTVVVVVVPHTSRIDAASSAFIDTPSSTLTTADGARDLALLAVRRDEERVPWLRTTKSGADALGVSIGTGTGMDVGVCSAGVPASVVVVSCAGDPAGVATSDLTALTTGSGVSTLAAASMHARRMRSASA